MRKILVLFCAGLILVFGLASCSFNTVEVQSGQSGADADKPEQSGQSGQSSQPSEPDPPEGSWGHDTDEDQGSGDEEAIMKALKGFPPGTLGKSIQGFDKIRVTITDWSNGSENKTTKSGEITEKDEMRRVLRLVSPFQKVKDIAATCLFSHHFDFMGKGGKITGRVGVCQMPKFRERHPAVLVEFGHKAKMVSRQGIVIEKALGLTRIAQKYAK